MVIVIVDVDDFDYDSSQKINILLRSGEIKLTPASYQPSTQSLFLPTTREYTISIVSMRSKQINGDPWSVLQKELINTTV